MARQCALSLAGSLCMGSLGVHRATISLSVLLLLTMEGQMVDQAVSEYRASRVALAWSTQSITRYESAIGGFLSWLSPKTTAATFSDADVRAYQSVLARRSSSARTIALTLSAIRSFSKWLVEIGLREDDPTAHVRWPKLPKVPHRALSSDQLAQLHGAIA